MIIKKFIPILILTSITLLIVFFLFFIINKPLNNEDQARQETIQNDLNKLNNKQKPQTTPIKIINIVQISLTPNGFLPKEITIDKNTKVIWTNNSNKIATVDSNPHPMHTDHPELNIGSFEVGKKLEFIFTESGKYGYHNHFLNEQEGIIIVK